MKEVYVVIEVVNNFILGVYSSELSYIDKIFEFLKAEVEGGYESEEEMLHSSVKDDFIIFKVPLDENCELFYKGFSNKKAFSQKGEEVKNFITYKDLKERIRELKIENIVD